MQNQMLPENLPNEENLLQVIKTVRAYIGYQDSECFETFDTMLATLFIICGGSVEKWVSIWVFRHKTWLAHFDNFWGTFRTLHIVACVIPLPISTFIWPQVTPNHAKKKYLFGHLIEWLLYQEVPHVFAALMVGMHHRHADLARGFIAFFSFRGTEYLGGWSAREN